MFANIRDLMSNIITSDKNLTLMKPVVILSGFLCFKSELKFEWRRVNFFVCICRYVPQVLMVCRDFILKIRNF